MKKYKQIPAVVYGNKYENTHLLLNHDEVLNAIKSISFFKSKITLNINDKLEVVKIQDIQRHPFKEQILHVDFIKV
jgi:large subunit ribosomal protein L25